MWKIKTLVAGGRSRKKEDSWLDKNWWVVAALIFFLVPCIVFPPLIFSFLFLLIYVGIIIGLLAFFLSLTYIGAKIDEMRDKGSTVPVIPYSGSHERRPRHSERAVLEDTKIMIRKVDRRRGIKKEAYMRKRRIEVTREVNDLDILTEPEEDKMDFSDLWRPSRHKKDEEG
jgi:predicted membrane protein